MFLDGLKYTQRQRLAYIDFRLMFHGSVYRGDIVEKYDVGLSVASRDLSLYKKLTQDNLRYSRANKRYYQTSEFDPLFMYEPHRTLMKFAYGLTDGLGDSAPNFEFIPSLNGPDVFHVARIIQAINNNKVVEIEYIQSEFAKHRLLAPHSIFFCGYKWYFRAFDTSTQTFGNFEFLLIANVILFQREVSSEARLSSDVQWIEMIELQLVAHPQNILKQRLIQQEYNMKNGVLKVNVRVAVAQHYLKYWNVDCSEDASSADNSCKLHLRNYKSAIVAGVIFD